jgi:endoglycosylceramidase
LLSRVSRVTQGWSRFLVAIGWLALPCTDAVATPPAPGAPLSVAGRHFVDGNGRVVILRGVSLSGGSKVPPFLPVLTEGDLDPLPSLGFNVIRLVFIWEAYEPIPGGYDESYLARLRAVAWAAWQRGMYVIIDVHQDGFSRHVSRGSGDGFPRWAVSPRARASVPDNSPSDHRWQLLMATDPATYRSFDDFFADAYGVRSRYLAMLGRLAGAFATVPGVIGYDLLNEPWGDEQSDLAPLYCDAAAAVHSQHPTALLFLEGHVRTNSGIQTKLPRLAIPNTVYAPHYYKPLTILLDRWHGGEYNIDRAFAHMTATAEAWDVPLFVGEFGIAANARNAGAYVTTLYDRLDACLASGAQWNYTPTWTEALKDGWNAEDFNILDPSRYPRPNFPLRPYPRLTAGIPLRFAYRAPATPGQGASLEFTWLHCPDRGETELFLPMALFPPGSALTIHPAEVSCQYDPLRQVLVCRAPFALTATLGLCGPTRGAVLPSSQSR